MDSRLIALFTKSKYDKHCSIYKFDALDTYVILEEIVEVVHQLYYLIVCLHMKMD